MEEFFSFVAVWQFLDEFFHMRLFCCTLNLFIGCIQFSVGDIILERTSEQKDILLDNADLFTERAFRHIADIDTMARNFSRTDTVKPRNTRPDHCYTSTP